MLPDDTRDWWLGAAGRPWPGVSGSVGADEWRWPPKMPPSPRKPCLWEAGWPLPPKGVCRVALLACFSLFCIFLRNRAASFSSTKDRPARHSSISKVWKKVRSWLYDHVSKISWSHITPRFAGWHLGQYRRRRGKSGQ